MSNARALIEVTAAVLPPEVNLVAPCGEDDLHAPHAITPLSGCSGVPLTPTGWIRNRPEVEHTKVWGLSDEQWDTDAENRRRLLHELANAALEYAEDLMCRPDQFNHVQVTWIWL